MTEKSRLILLELSIDTLRQSQNLLEKGEIEQSKDMIRSVIDALIVFQQDASNGKIPVQHQ